MNIRIYIYINTHFDGVYVSPLIVRNCLLVYVYTYACVYVCVSECLCVGVCDCKLIRRIRVSYVGLKTSPSVTPERRRFARQLKRVSITAPAVTASCEYRTTISKATITTADFLAITTSSTATTIDTTTTIIATITTAAVE